MTFIATQLISKEDKRELEKVFLHFDKNKDGRLSKEEILNGYEEYYGTPPKMDEIDALFAKIDTDGSGTIDYSEFVVATLNQKTLLNDEKLRAAFKMFDRVSGYVTQDGSGSISAKELRDVLGAGKAIDVKVIEEILNEVDINGDGEISFEEFSTLMKNIIHKS